MGREGCSLPHPQPSFLSIPQSQPQLSFAQGSLHPQSLQQSLPQPQSLHPQRLPHPQLLLQDPPQTRPCRLLHPPLPLQQNKSSKIQIQLFISSTPFFYRLCRRVHLDKENPGCYI